MELIRYDTMPATLPSLMDCSEVTFAETVSVVEDGFSPFSRIFSFFLRKT
jgi:hypothetical protein